jgi:hypothetical protein
MPRKEIAREREIKVEGPLKVVLHKEFLQIIVTRALLHQTLNLLDT